MGAPEPVGPLRTPSQSWAPKRRLANEWDVVVRHEEGDDRQLFRSSPPDGLARRANTLAQRAVGTPTAQRAATLRVTWLGGPSHWRSVPSARPHRNEQQPFGLLGSAGAVLLVEALDAAGGVDDAHLACVERV
jgi:hypothetical protein